MRHLYKISTTSVRQRCLSRVIFYYTACRVNLWLPVLLYFIFHATLSFSTREICSCNCQFNTSSILTRYILPLQFFIIVNRLITWLSCCLSAHFTFAILWKTRNVFFTLNYPQFSEHLLSFLSCCQRFHSAV